MTEPIPLQPRQNCPKCGFSLRRISRQEGDVADASKRRYACMRRNCNWEGLLPHMVSRSLLPPTDRSRMPPRRSLARAFFVGLVVVAAVSFMALIAERMVASENRGTANAGPRTP